jgi:hypothetical protein
MRKISVLVICMILILVSCKKEEKGPAPTVGTGTGSGGGNTPVVSNATTFYGIFTTGSYSTVLSSTDTPSSSQMASSYFSSQATQYINSATAVKVNNIWLNGDSLSYNSSNKYYTQYWNVNLSTETWSVNGANGIGTFTININTITPSVNTINFQDSISISAGFSVAVNNVSNITSARILVFDGTNTSSSYVQKTINAGNNTIIFTPADLANLTPTQTGYLALVLTNSKAYKVSGKDYQFNREAQCTMHFKIKP